MEDLNRFLKNLLTVLLIFYIVYFIPKLKRDIVLKFDNIVVRLINIIIILIVGLDDPVISLLLSVCFVMTHNRLQKLNKNDNNKIVNLIPGNNYDYNVEKSV